jgi:2-polyprenyl-3-methyl-5-hydroxy-6-metoxy-1,4-benzoquinol methylase
MSSSLPTFPFKNKINPTKWNLKPRPKRKSASRMTANGSYREGSGRTFQAANDHYIVSFPLIWDWTRADISSLPVCCKPNSELISDNREFARLDAQHHAIKLTQGDVNYLAPLAELLNTESADGSEKKVLDVGCGSGIWHVDPLLDKQS